jgi:hypothetical protein
MREGQEGNVILLYFISDLCNTQKGGNINNRESSFLEQLKVRHEN